MVLKEYYYVLISLLKISIYFLLNNKDIQKDIVFKKECVSSLTLRPACLRGLKSIVQ